jgi:hypothetical protein
MLSATAWMWLLGVLALVAVGGFVLGALRDRAKRRARHAYYRQATQSTRPQSPGSSAPAPLSGGMTPEQAASIRAHAERTAQRDWSAARSSAINPYEHGTSEYVLWYATYHLRMGELAEQAEAEAERDRRQDPP